MPHTPKPIASQERAWVVYTRRAYRVGVWPTPSAACDARAMSTAFFSDDAVHVVLWENVALVDIVGTVHPSHVQEMQRGYERILQRHPRAVGLVRLSSNVEAGSPDANEASKAMLKALGARLACVALVFEDPGVRGVVFRTLIRGLNVFVRGTALRPCTSLAEGAALLVPHVVASGRGGVTAAELVAAFHGARSAPRPAASPGA